MIARAVGEELDKYERDECVRKTLSLSSATVEIKAAVLQNILHIQLTQDPRWSLGLGIAISIGILMDSK